MKNLTKVLMSGLLLTSTSLMAVTFDDPNGFAEKANAYYGELSFDSDYKLGDKFVTETTYCTQNLETKVCEPPKEEMDIQSTIEVIEKQPDYVKLETKTYVNGKEIDSSQKILTKAQYESAGALSLQMELIKGEVNLAIFNADEVKLSGQITGFEATLGVGMATADMQVCSAEECHDARVALVGFKKSNLPYFLDAVSVGIENTIITSSMKRIK